MIIIKVLISIKPEFVNKIMTKEKRFEYRRIIFNRTDIKTCVIYATKPVGKVVGEFQIEKIIKTHPSLLWEQTKNFSGISKEYFDDYFGDRNIGYAIQIRYFTPYEQPLTLSQINVKAAPQSFRYLDY